jgi:hypothetical protein
MTVAQMAVMTVARMAALLVVMMVEWLVCLTAVAKARSKVERLVDKLDMMMVAR